VYAVTTDAVPSELSGWGRYPVVRGYVREGEDLERVTAGAVLTRGLGRAYGDAALPPSGEHVVAVSTRADRLLAFDPATGIVRVEAGASLRALVRAFLPRGWFPPASPGTQLVTAGGLVAADVHGKSHHHEGTFGAHVTGLRMRVADGRVLEVSPSAEPQLFRATVGGMGLTGHILEVAFRMRRVPSAWILAESERFSDLDTLVDALRAASRSWPYTVAWVDGLGRHRGRGILQRGRWAEPDEAPPGFPAPKRTLAVALTLPDWFLSSPLVQSLNATRYLLHGAAVRRGLLHPESFFYPLDALGAWNLLYGKRGFTQYQAVVPIASDPVSYRRVLGVVERLGANPFLCVLKDFGDEGAGLLSFPRPGLSIVLDLPVDGTRTQAVVDALNDVVVAAGGRVYLAKDAFTRDEHFRCMEPRLDAWLAVRRRWDPDARVRSALSVRLMGDAP
jgi:FAD/FMN-containing dehydrogenase